MTSWLKTKRVLTDRQLSKVKTSSALLFGLLTVQGAMAAASYWYDGEEYEKRSITLFPRGQIVEFTNLDEFCHR